jgi:hypothetical protein
MIEPDEYQSRQATARHAARDRGLCGIIVWSRGGSTQDHYAEVYYLQAFIHTTRSSLTFPKYGEPAGIAHSRFLRMGHLL